MNFIVSNSPFKNSKKIFNIYYIGEYLQNGDHIIFIKLYYYPKASNSVEEILQNIIKKDISYISELEGYFCGVYYDIKNDKIFFFTDKLGYYDLFYFINENLIIISDDFNEITTQLKIREEDINIESLLEFIFFQYSLFEKTFIKNLSFCSMGSIYFYDIRTLLLRETQYFDYLFKINHNISQKELINQLDILFNNSIKRIINTLPTYTTYGIGLSGGMDSRLTAYYFKKYNLKIKSFVFGEPNSDAYIIARKLAKLLKIQHFELGFNKNFFKYYNESIQFNPMMDLLFTWYYAVFEKLPTFDILLTGFNGDNQFGSHLEKSDIYIQNDEELAENIIKRYFTLENTKTILEYFKDKNILNKIKKNLINFSQKSQNLKYWQKIEEFNYKNRQRKYIKNNPSFNFFGKYDSISIFIDPNLFDFLLTIPFEQRINRNLFFSFIKSRIPTLLKIRGEGDTSLSYKNKIVRIILKCIYLIDIKLNSKFFLKPSHKNVNLWLSDNVDFIEFCVNMFKRENKFFYNLIYVNKIDELIKKKKWNLQEIYLIMRLLTIKIFLDKMLKY